MKVELRMSVLTLHAETELERDLLSNWFNKTTPFLAGATYHLDDNGGGARNLSIEFKPKQQRKPSLIQKLSRMIFK